MKSYKIENYEIINESGLKNFTVTDQLLIPIYSITVISILIIYQKSYN